MYFDAILDGASGRLAQHLKRPYSDTKTSVYWLKRFRNEIRIAKNDQHQQWSVVNPVPTFPVDWTRVA
jgi:hypothetical protein